MLLVVFWFKYLCLFGMLHVKVRCEKQDIILHDRGMDIRHLKFVSKYCAKTATSPVCTAITHIAHIHTHTYTNSFEGYLTLLLT